MSITRTQGDTECSRDPGSAGEVATGFKQIAECEPIATDHQ